MGSGRGKTRRVLDPYVSPSSRVAPEDSNLHDFNDGSGEVLANRHLNPDGSVGGWVAITALIHSSAYVGRDAQVYGYASVLNSAIIDGRARVSGNAEVVENAVVIDDAVVGQRARIHGAGRVRDSACVLGAAKVAGEVRGRTDVVGTEVKAGTVREGGMTRKWENGPLSLGDDLQAVQF